MAILETHNIGKRYGRRRWALRHVDIAVPDGSITALVGPNGSGKSTLLKAWVGFEKPTEGHLPSTASTRGATAAARSSDSATSRRRPRSTAS